jgi:anti-anti-sigma factor
MALARVAGPLDIETVKRFQDRLDRLSTVPHRLVLDLRQVEYIDSEGVRALLQLQGQLESGGGELRLVVVPGSRVQRTLRLLQLQERLSIYDSAAEAWIRRPAAA